MASRIERPRFFEGQILSAADLELSAAGVRARLARDVRYKEVWGIAVGLTLEKKPRKTAADEDYVEVELQAGVAFDGTGREIVVSEATRLSEDLFNVAVKDANAWYPVFLIGRDERRVASTGLNGACSTQETTRVVEGYEISFGRPGDETQTEEPRIEITDGPGGVVWPVLVGFVQWDATISTPRFKDAASKNGAGVGLRYAGVRADEVVARGGTLTLRSRPETEAGKPAIVLDDKKSELRFGLQNEKGAVTSVLTVDGEGNLTAEGTIKSMVLSGVLADGGIATDGMEIPLPPGVDRDKVDSGQVVVHVHVTPRYQRPTTLLESEDWVPSPIECHAEGRRVHCRILWHRIDVATASPTEKQVHLGSVHYTVLAFVPEKKKGS